MSYLRRLWDWLAGSPAEPREPVTKDVTSFDADPPVDHPPKQRPVPIKPVAKAVMPPAVAPPVHPPLKRRPVLIALDFGTHSTKILLRQRGETARVVTIDDSADGYPWFVTPSLVRLSDGRLYFGQQALAREGGTLYRSLKVHLLSSSGQSDHANFPKGPTPDLLVACYLTWVLHRLKADLEELNNPPLFLNVAAPMNHIEDEALKERYLQIIQVAWESAFGEDKFESEQGMTLEEWSKRVKPLLERDVPDVAVRRYEVLPETVATIVSLSLDPRASPGMYMIVDMGAGTTELSVNHVSERGADQHVVCYADESATIGGDNFNWLDQLGSDDPVLANEKRDDLLTALAKLHKRVWALGYLKDAPDYAVRPLWKQLTVLLSGGGGRRKDVNQSILTTNPIYPWPFCESEYKIRWHYPTEIDFGRKLDSRSQEEVSLLTVAHGLSIERQKWPIVFSPINTKVRKPTPPAEQPPPYWYIDS